ncbi:MAG TPA: hypothetical protein VHY35_14565 [Stellaceae bacterium]|nr:hypothetical protein [Stellaceae bacterium]
MTIDVSEETEAQLADEAKRRGISVDTLLTRFIGEHASRMTQTQSEPQLPVWHLGGTGALHRRDIYDDGR